MEIRYTNMNNIHSAQNKTRSIELYTRKGFHTKINTNNIFTRKNSACNQITKYPTADAVLPVRAIIYSRKFGSL
jgi:hypothetical protein